MCASMCIDIRMYVCAYCMYMVAGWDGGCIVYSEQLRYVLYMCAYTVRTVCTYSGTPLMRTPELQTPLYCGHMPLEPSDSLYFAIVHLQPLKPKNQDSPF